MSSPQPYHPLDLRWFAHVEGKTHGPYSGHKIKQMIEEKQLLESDLLCHEGGRDWLQAKDDPLWGSFFHYPDPPASISFEQAPTSATAEFYSPSVPERTMAQKFLAGTVALVFLFGVFVFIVSVITDPTPSKRCSDLPTLEQAAKCTWSVIESHRSGR